MGQMGIMLYLMIAPEKAVQKLETFQRMNSESTKKNLPQIVNIVRWTLLGLVTVQTFAVIIALIARCVVRPEKDYQDMEEEERTNRELENAAKAKELHAKIQADFGKSESASGRQNEFSIAASRSSNDPEHCAWRNPIEVDLEAPAHSVTDIWPNSSSPDAVPVRATWTRVAQKRAMGDKS